MPISIPDIKDKYVIALIAKIGVKNAPILLVVLPEENSKVLDCFPTVQEKVIRSGGKMILGWQFWKSKNLIEAEFHAVWKSPEDKLIDVTPKPIAGIKHTLFLVDENLIYDGRQKDNFRINITNNSLVDDFINVCESIFIFENKGERAYQYELKLSNHEQEKYLKLKEIKKLYQTMITNNFTKNTRCLCGSGSKFKNCHGKNLQQNLSRLI